MKTLPVSSNVVSPELSRGTQVIHAVEKEQWLQSLTAGQILKGRIMRHYGEGRYAVSFGGQERVVDSAVPLSVGELLRGKVVGVSDNAVSMRVISMTHQTNSGNAPLKTDDAQKPVIPGDLELAGISLTQLQKKVIEKAAQLSANPALATKIGMYLVKIGLPVSIELIRAMSGRVLDSKSPAYMETNQDIPELVGKLPLDSVDFKSPEWLALIDVLANFFRKQYAETQNAKEAMRNISAEEKQLVGKHNKDAFTNDDELSKKLNRYLLSILNIQTGSVLHHRLQTLPVMINGHMAEFDLALFDHSQSQSGDERVRSRYMKFCLTTEFGNVMLNAHVINNRLRLKIETESEAMAMAFEERTKELSAGLENLGWILELADYKTGLQTGSPAASIVNHVLAQDSLQVVM